MGDILAPLLQQADEKMRAKTLLAFMLISLWLFVTPFITHAEDKYWVGGSGSWDDPNNWSVTEGGPGGAGPPAPGSLPASLDGENAYLIQSDANNNVVSYENPQESNSIGAMVIDATD